MVVTDDEQVHVGRGTVRDVIARLTWKWLHVDR